jgi:hypothetical protein
MRFKRRSTRKLFEKTALRSNFCFYSSGEVCTLESPNIIRMGGPISERGGLAPICVLNHRSSKKLWQLIICTPDCPEVRPIISEGLCGQILGYRYIFQPFIEEQDWINTNHEPGLVSVRDLSYLTYDSMFADFAVANRSVLNKRPPRLVSI